LTGGAPGGGGGAEDAFTVAAAGDNGPVLRRAVSDETSDDILAKYRKKGNNNSAAAAGFHSSAEGDTSVADGGVGNGRGGRAEDAEDAEDAVDERLLIDRMNVEGSYAFQDAKRKLRLMLSEADLTALTNMTPASKKKASAADQGGLGDGGAEKENEVAWFLRVQLAEANNLQDRALVAQLHETLRCISLFDAEECTKLIASLREDYRRRAPYLGYLVRCRQGLLSSMSHQRRLVARMEAYRTVCSRHLVSVCITLFLEQREATMQAFTTQFKDVGTTHDEKVRKSLFSFKLKS
jgi:hypothetical protein